MKVVAFNGSPRRDGNTDQALRLVMAELEGAGIETELIHVGAEQIQECTACGMCARNRDERCVLPGDSVNEWIQKMKEADGILFGSPTHFAGMSAKMKAFMDRAFYVSGNNGGLLRHKVGAAVVAVRRSGGVPAFDSINRYLLYSEMVLPTTNYWNVIHGTAAGEALQDAEGGQIMHLLGRNMAWLLQALEAGRQTHPAPEAEKKIRMNFIR